MLQFSFWVPCLVSHGVFGRQASLLGLGPEGLALGGSVVLSYISAPVLYSLCVGTVANLVLHVLVRLPGTLVVESSSCFSTVLRHLFFLRVLGGFPCGLCGVLCFWVPLLLLFC